MFWVDQEAFSAGVGGLPRCSWRCTLIELFESKEREPVAQMFFRFRPIGVHAIINYGQSKAEKWPKKYLSEKF